MLPQTCNIGAESSSTAVTSRVDFKLGNRPLGGEMSALALAQKCPYGKFDIKVSPRLENAFADCSQPPMILRHFGPEKHIQSEP